MSVYTKLSLQQVQNLLDNYSIGSLLSMKGIEDGVTNTIYLITTTDHQLVLTIFEELNKKELPVYLDLTEFLRKHGIACPEVFHNKQQQQIELFNNKPVIISEYLPGKTLITPNESQIAQVAQMLAKLHLVGRGYPSPIANQRGAAWRTATYNKLINTLDKHEAQLLTDEMHFQQQLNWSDLPSGIIHSDLFRDNVLFDGEHLTGFIDFYYACTDTFIYDIAITINDWCLDHNALVDHTKIVDFITQYEKIRPLEDKEKSSLNNALRLGALRFYLSRLNDFHFTAGDDLVQIKDPSAYQKILLQHQRQ